MQPVNINALEMPPTISTVRSPSLMIRNCLISGSWKEGMHKNRAAARMLSKTASHKTMQEEDWCLQKLVKSVAYSVTVGTTLALIVW